MYPTCFIPFLAALMLCMTLVLDQPAAAQAPRPGAESADARSLFVAGTSLASAGDEDKALDMFQKAVKAKPDYVLAWQNIGQIYQNRGKNEEALAAYSTALKFSKDNDRLLSKIIQCEEALGKVAERDRDRKALFELYKEGKVQRPFYVREQFAVGKTKVMALEYFELAGDAAVRYSFQVLDDAGDPKYRISLGSYAATDAIAHEMGQVGRDERIFHLDGYYPDGHRTFDMFTKEPTYEQTREMVVKIVDGKMKPKSSSVRPQQ